MCCSKCKACSCLGLIISIVLGAVVGVLFALGFIPFIVTAAWIAFGISVFALAFLLVAVIVGGATGPNMLTRCLCRNIPCLLAGIIGTLITSIAALSIVLNPVFVSVAALVALGGAFFTLLLIALIDFITCFCRHFCCER